MFAFLWFVLGWVLGIFTAHILELISRLLRTVWCLVTRSEGHESRSSWDVIRKNWKITQVRRFFGLFEPPSKKLRPY